MAVVKEDAGRNWSSSGKYGGNEHVCVDVKTLQPQAQKKDRVREHGSSCEHGSFNIIKWKKTGSVQNERRFPFVL